MSPIFPHQPWFRDKLKTGHMWEHFVADRLRERGLVVDVTPLKTREEWEDSDEYAGQVDVWFSRPGGTPAKLEVKGRGPKCAFTCPADWPYPTFICYRTTKGARDIPTLAVSEVTQAIIGVLDDGSQRRIVPITDRGRGTSSHVWVAPKSLLLSFDEWVDRAGEYLME